MWCSTHPGPNAVLLLQFELNQDTPGTMPSQDARSPAQKAVMRAVVHLSIDLQALIAEVALWAPVMAHKARVENENPTGAVYPHVRRARLGSGEKAGVVVDGIRLDRNNYANAALRRALKFHRRRKDGYQACHIWPNTCYDERYHTVLANLVLIPGPLVSLTDFDTGVIAALQYRAYELYDWHPFEVPPPERPSGYPEIWSDAATTDSRADRRSRREPAPTQADSQPQLQAHVRAPEPPSQRDFMRRLWREHGGEHDAIINAWVQAEASGEVVRASNMQGLPPQDYGRRLLYDGVKKGWLEK